MAAASSRDGAPRSRLRAGKPPLLSFRPIEIEPLPAICTVALRPSPPTIARPGDLDEEPCVHGDRGGNLSWSDDDSKGADRAELRATEARGVSEGDWRQED